MPGKRIADFFSGILSVVLPNDRKEAALCIRIVMLLAVDPRKAPFVIIHNGFAVFATFNYIQNKPLFGVAPVKKPLHAHGLR